MEELEINKHIQNYLNKIAFLKKKEILIAKKGNKIINNYCYLLSELFGKVDFHKKFEELSINVKEFKETESDLKNKINSQDQQKQLISKKLSQLMDIIKYNKNFGFEIDSTEAEHNMTVNKLFGYTVAIHNTSSKDVINSIFINENSLVPIKALEFNLNQITDSELNHKMWELVKEANRNNVNVEISVENRNYKN